MSIDYSKFAFPKNGTKKQEKESSKQVTRIKQKSSKLAKMERNRTSIITDKMDKCFICGKKKDDLHEIFRGRNRKKSMQYGLVVPLCRDCHKKVDNNRADSLELEKIGKAIFIKKYGKDKFTEEFK